MKKAIPLILFAVLLGIICFFLGRQIGYKEGYQSSDNKWEKKRKKEEKQRIEQARIDTLNIYLKNAEVLHKKRRYKDAMANIDTALLYEAGEKDEILYIKANFYYDQRKYSKAIEAYTSVIDASYDWKNTLYKRAICYNKLGEKQNAVTDLKKASELGNKEAEELHDKINPVRKRVAYYVTRCCDGSTSSATGRGACSHHGGVCNWNDPVYEEYRKYK